MMIFLWNNIYVIRNVRARASCFTRAAAVSRESLSALGEKSCSEAEPKRRRGPNAIGHLNG